MKKLTKEDIQKYGTEKEIKLLEMHHDGVDYVSDENDADGPFSDAKVLGTEVQKKIMDSADIDNVIITRHRKRLSDGSVVYDIHIADFKTPNAPAVVMCVDERSSRETFEELVKILKKA